MHNHELPQNSFTIPGVDVSERNVILASLQSPNRVVRCITLPTPTYPHASERIYQPFYESGGELRFMTEELLNADQIIIGNLSTPEPVFAPSEGHFVNEGENSFAGPLRAAAFNGNTLATLFWTDMDGVEIFRSTRSPFSIKSENEASFNNFLEEAETATVVDIVRLPLDIISLAKKLNAA